MARVSPTLEGFRAAFRRPSFALAEITWRWMIGATAFVLIFYGFFEYLNTLPVTSGELFFLRTRHPYLVWRALAHILRGSMSRGVIAMMVAALLLCLLWILAASLGRMATVRAMIDYFRERTAAFENAGTDKSEQQSPSDMPLSLSSLLRLNFLRATVTLAAILGTIGAAILASMASTTVHPRPGLPFFLFLPMAALVGLFWWVLNWFLSLSTIFAVRDGADAIQAISSAVDFCRDRFGAVLAVSTSTALLHIAAFVIATSMVSLPLGLMPLVPWRLVLLCMLVVSLLYFALADWISTARFAGYVCILETPAVLLAPPPPPPVIAAPALLATTIDRDELILSDLPHPATG